MTACKLLSAPDDLKKLLEKARTIAVVGLSEKPERDSHSIALYMKEQGYRIVGVNPGAPSILGETCYPALGAIPEEKRRQVDLVVIFRRPEDVPPIIDDAARLGFKHVWLQVGVSSPAALEAAGRHGLTVVADACLRTAHLLFVAKPKPLH